MSRLIDIVRPRIAEKQKQREAMLNMLKHHAIRTTMVADTEFDSLSADLLDAIMNDIISSAVSCVYSEAHADGYLDVTWLQEDGFQILANLPTYFTKQLTLRLNSQGVSRFEIIHNNANGDIDRRVRLYFEDK